MDDSIITILVVVTLGIFQLVVSINKKKRAREQAMRSPSEYFAPDSELEALEDLSKMFYPVEEPVQPAPEVVKVKPTPVPSPRLLKPEEEGGPIAKPISLFVDEDASEQHELLLDFTPQKAIIYSEILNPKWNS